MSTSAFNLTPETMAKLKEAQMDCWKPQPGPNGEQPPVPFDDTWLWKHRQLEKVQVDKVTHEVEARDQGEVQLIKVQYRCTEGLNSNRVHTDWIRLWPPYEDSGNFSRNTMANMARLGQLLDAAGFDENAKATDLLGSVTQIPAGTVVVGLLELSCIQRKDGSNKVVQEFLELHAAA